MTVAVENFLTKPTHISKLDKHNLLLIIILKQLMPHMFPNKIMCKILLKIGIGAYMRQLWSIMVIVVIIIIMIIMFLMLSL